MRGQFIFSTCNAAGLDVRAVIRNSSRRLSDVSMEARQAGMAVGLKVFDDGKLVFADENFATVPLNETFEVSKITCPALDGASSKGERIAVAECRLKGEAETFNQEHQLIYENPRNGYLSSLLYDQRPVPSARKPSPIILIAPKIWISRSINTLVAFASAAPQDDVIELEEVPLELTVLSASGEVLFSEKKQKLKNSVLLLNLRELLTDRVTVGEAPQFFTLAARGGAGAYAITTFVVNEASGTFALEHSLPPPYYVHGDGIGRVRAEANRFAASTQEKIAS